MSTDLRQQQTTPHAPSDVVAPKRRLVTARPSGKRRRRPLHSAIMVIMAVSLVTAVGMLYVLQTNYVASLGYEMSELQRMREARSVENQRLRAQIAELQSLDRIEEIAIDDLGMEPYDDYRFLTVTWPETSELPTPEPPQPEPESLIDRLRGVLFGSGSAVDVVEAEGED